MGDEGQVPEAAALDLSFPRQPLKIFITLHTNAAATAPTRTYAVTASRRTNRAAPAAPLTAHFVASFAASNAGWWPWDGEAAPSGLECRLRPMEGRIWGAGRGGGAAGRGRAVDAPTAGV